VPEPELLEPHDPPLPATVGRYEVVRLLGEGAMGRVLLAHDPVLDRDVAVKHLRGDLKIPRDTRHGLLARMRHEARAAARVAHPNLVVLHDMGEDASVGLFLVFEYVEGPTLKQRILDGGRLAPEEAARLARELGAALTVAHEAGILHRDVKPENVMLAKTGGKIADFGIARIPDSTLTHQGGLMGTPAYSAPETFRAGKFSPASDQFSMAASIYEAISGRRAFPGDDAVTVAARIASDTPDRFAVELGLSPAVDDVLARALDRRPEARYPSCDVFGAALSRSLSRREAVDLTPVAAPAANGASPSASAAHAVPERRTGQVVLGALLVVVTAALVVRTALRPSDAAVEPAQAAPEPPVPTTTARALHPRTPSLVPLPPRTARPHLDASAAPSASAAPVADAGAPIVPGGWGAPSGAPIVQGVSSATPAPIAPPPGQDGDSLHPAGAVH
jgi:eukaryotic-like serine/threonine-protein kinase